MDLLGWSIAGIGLRTPEERIPRDLESRVLLLPRGFASIRRSTADLSVSTSVGVTYKDTPVNRGPAARWWLTISFIDDGAGGNSMDFTVLSIDVYDHISSMIEDVGYSY
jgi:hypothetical protein